MSMDKCPGHYKVHVHGRDGPGRPVHGHCPVPLPALSTTSQIIKNPALPPNLKNKKLIFHVLHNIFGS